MKTIVLPAALAALCVTSALAADDPVTSRYGNTTVITTSQRAVIKVWYEADHTVTWMTGPVTRKGTWALENGNMCITLTDPPPGVNGKTCAPFEVHKVGDSWSVGEGAAKLNVQLVAGHQQ